MVEQMVVQQSIDRFLGQGGEPELWIRGPSPELESAVRTEYPYRLYGVLTPAVSVFSLYGFCKLAEFSDKLRLESMGYEIMSHAMLVLLDDSRTRAKLRLQEEPIGLKTRMQSKCNDLVYGLFTLVMRQQDWHLTALYSALQDNQSLLSPYRNYLAVCFLRFIEKRGVPLDPYVSEQLGRVAYLFPDDSALFPSPPGTMHTKVSI